MSQRFVGRARRLHEFIGRGRHVLLGYVDSPGAQVQAFVDGCRALHGLLPGAASAVLIAPPGCAVPDDEPLIVLSDPQGEFLSAFRAASGTAWIVRPDGHIGWRSGACSEAALQSWGRILKG